MEEDEVANPVTSPPLEESISEPPKAEQCGTVLATDDSEESPSLAVATDEAPPSTVAEELAGEGAVGEALMKSEERENEVIESEPGAKEEVCADEIAKVEDTPDVPEKLEVKNEEVAELENLAPVTEELEEKDDEELEVKNEEVVKFEDVVPVTEESEEKHDEELEVKNEEVAKLDVMAPIIEELEEKVGEESELKNEEVAKFENVVLATEKSDEKRDEGLEVKNKEIAKFENIVPATEDSKEKHDEELEVKNEEVEKLDVMASVTEELEEKDDEELEEKNDEVAADEVAKLAELKEKDDEELEVKQEEVAKIEDHAAVTEELKEKDVEELEVKNEEVAAADEIAKLENVSSVTEHLEKKDEIARVKEMPLDTEELEVNNEGGIGDGEPPQETIEETEPGEAEVEGVDVLQVNKNEASPVPSKDEELGEEEETAIVDTEMEAVKSGSGGKRKRGRNSKATPVKASSRKIVGEDVCFICLDGGNLVLCDRRGCPKAYHPSCVDHDEEFFKTKGRWNCGWHLCNKCGKNAYFMCYTCTFSLCKGCCKEAVVFCVRGNRGFCESCMGTVTMIENSEQNEAVAFDDKSSWEYLFKDYWIEQKRKLCITSDELVKAKNPLKGSDAAGQVQRTIEVHDDNNDVGTDSDSSGENFEAANSIRKRVKRQSKTVDSDTDSSSEKDAGTAEGRVKRRPNSQIKESCSDSEYSSKGDTSNKRGKKPRRLSKSRSMDGNSATAQANEGLSAEGSVEWGSKELLEFVMHMKDGDTSVLTQFDVQGLLLEYIKRNKLRDRRRQSQIICDSMLQRLFGKPRVGHFEMLKLLESHFLLKDDSHADDNRGSVDGISQLDVDDHTDSFDAGRSKGRKSRKRGEERGQSNLDDYAAIDMHNINLIYLRRNLMEALMEDTNSFHDKVVGSFVRIRISGSSQKLDIYRLVQIMGTSKAAEPYKVGKRATDVMLEILNLDKTEIIPIDTISNQEFTEDECKRLRQSIKCGLINRMTVGDVLGKTKELQEVRVIDWLETEIVRLSHLRDRASEKGRKKELRECVEKLQLLKSPEERQRRLEEIPEVHADPKMDPSCESEDESEIDNKSRFNSMRQRESGFFRSKENFSPRKGGSVSKDSWSTNARPPNRNMELSRNISGKGFSSRKEDTAAVSQTSKHSWNNGVDQGTSRSNSSIPRLTSDPLCTRAEHSGVRPDTSASASSSSSHTLSAGVAQGDAKINETEKMWHYRDPTSKVQGPFSMAQLRKWSNTGYFPADLKIWKALQSEVDSVLLTEALAGRFQKESPSVGLQSDMVSKISKTPSSVLTSTPSRNVHNYGSKNDSSKLPSPTPVRSTAVWGAQGGNERLPSPTPTSPSDPSRVFSRQSKGVSVVGNKLENVAASVGVVQAASITNASGPRPEVPLISGSLNTQQISSQHVAHMENQSFVPPEIGLTQTNLGLDAKGVAQGFSNVAQAGTVQNPAVYAHGWASGYVARPDIANANLTHNNQNTVPLQLAHSQWTGAPVNNQASSYGAGYPSGPGNMASNLPAMPSQNAWRAAPTNMTWSGQPQHVNPNLGWTVPPSAAALGPSAGTAAAPMGQLLDPSPGASAMPSGNAAMGWQGTGSGLSAGTTNPSWGAPPGNGGAWSGNHNRNGGGAQWNRQSSFGSGGQRVCKYHESGHCRMGSSCDYMHT